MSDQPLIFTNCFPCQTHTCSQEALCISEVFFQNEARVLIIHYRKFLLVWRGRVWARASCQCVTEWGGLDETRDWQAPSQAALGFTTTATSSKKAQVKGQELSFHRGLCLNPLYMPGQRAKRILRMKQHQIRLDRIKKRNDGHYNNGFWSTNSKEIGLQEKCFWNVDGWQT